MNGKMLIADFNFHYEVKYFRKFERQVESFKSQDEAEKRFTELVQSGQWDAVYTYCDGELLDTWAENYDEEGGGHFEELSYLKTIPNRFAVRRRKSGLDGDVLSDPHSVDDRLYPAYKGDFFLIDREHDDQYVGGTLMTDTALEDADHLADLYNALHRLTIVAQAARFACQENDPGLSESLLSDGLNMVNSYLPDGDK